MAATRTRYLENLLKFKVRNRETRKLIYKQLITALVLHERIETTINRCHDLSRVAERVSIIWGMTIFEEFLAMETIENQSMPFHAIDVYFISCLQMIDLAKEGDEATINSWITASRSFSIH